MRGGVVFVFHAWRVRGFLYILFTNSKTARSFKRGIQKAVTVLQVYFLQLVRCTLDPWRYAVLKSLYGLRPACLLYKTQGNYKRKIQ